MQSFTDCLKSAQLVHISTKLLPKIDIRLDLPKLQNVVQGFIDKGYVLADEELIN